jgi:hypothetical protein
MNPWGIMNDWLRLEVDERVQRYGTTRRLEHTPARVAATVTATLPPTPELSTASALSRDDVTACA